MTAPDYRRSYTAFRGVRHLVTGTPDEVAPVIRATLDAPAEQPLQVFDNASGRSVDLDIQATEAEIRTYLSYQSRRSEDKAAPVAATAADRPRGRGRPKLGVVAREVTLLPRHWAWLADQPGGASVALRKLVEKARKESVDQDQSRQSSERAYQFMLAMGGDLPGFEEAMRALFAGDRIRFDAQIAAWPVDIRNHASWLAFGRVRLAAS